VLRLGAPAFHTVYEFKAEALGEALHHKTCFRGVTEPYTTLDSFAV